MFQTCWVSFFCWKQRYFKDYSQTASSVGPDPAHTWPAWISHGPDVARIWANTMLLSGLVTKQLTVAIDFHSNFSNCIGFKFFHLDISSKYIHLFNIGIFPTIWLPMKWRKQKCCCALEALAGVNFYACCRTRLCQLRTPQIAWALWPACAASCWRLRKFRFNIFSIKQCDYLNIYSCQLSRIDLILLNVIPISCPKGVPVPFY